MGRRCREVDRRMPIIAPNGLRIGIVSALLHPRFGGPATVVGSHIKTLSRNNTVSVFGVAEAKERPELAKLYPAAQLFDLVEPKIWFRGAGLHQALRAAARDLDVLHAHMVWDQPVFAAWRVSREFGIPLVVTPHGSFAEKWRYNSPHKRLYRALIAGRIMKNAATVHALTKAEADAIQELRLQMNIAIIPNGVPEEYFKIGRDRTSSEAAYPSLAGRKVVLYLARLWGEKGLDILPEAWAKVVSTHPSALLVIAGADYRNYRKTLEEKIERFKIAHSCLLTGPVYESAKTSLLAAASAFVLPSRSEALSMALIEAAAAGLPSVFTPGCNAQELAQAGGGWQVERTPQSLGAKLIEVLAMSEPDLNAVGLRARRWAQDNFNLDAVGDKLCHVYSMAMKQTLPLRDHERRRIGHLIGKQANKI